MIIEIQKLEQNLGAKTLYLYNYLIDLLKIKVKKVKYIYKLKYKFLKVTIKWWLRYRTVIINDFWWESEYAIDWAEHVN